MTIYVFLFIILIIGLFPKPLGKSNAYVLIAGVLLFVIIGLRGVSVGIDTLSYVDDFRYYFNKSWAQIYEDAFTHKEPLFYLTVGLITRITHWYPAYLMFWALFPTVALYSVFKDELKKCKIDILLAIIVLFNLGIIAFFQAGIRQTAAMSIILLASRNLVKIDNTHFYSFVRDKHFYYFLLGLFIAFCFHKSAFIFILALFIKDIKVRWWYVFIPVGTFFLSSYIQLDFITQAALLVFQNEQYGQYGTSYQSELSLSLFIMQAIIFIVCYFPRNNVIKQDPHMQAYYNFSVLGLAFASLTGLIAEMYRLSFYWSMFYIILLPRSIKAYNNKFVRDIGYAGLIIGSMIYLFFLSAANLTDFEFF